MSARTARDPFAVPNGASRDEGADRRKAALVLTSHPDDESYFFAPTIQALKAANVETHLVCLSDGGAGGDGETRKKELLRVKELFELEGMCIVEAEDLMDGMANAWPAKTVMTVLDEYTGGAPTTFDYVVTFDSGGVSGHLNHVCTYEGTKQWIEERKMSVSAAGDRGGCPQVWVLETTNAVRKLSGALDFANSYLESLIDSRRVFVPSASPIEVLKAVRLHASQFVWYRKLFVVFSRYTYMNTLRRID
jgi:N-acetylglucosaminylphosphatidylinositol deacetylase